MAEIKRREEVKEEYKWNLGAIYKDLEELGKDEKKALELIQKIPSYQTEMLQSAEKLYETTQSIFGASRIVQKIYTYAHLKYNEDIALASSRELLSRVENLDLKLEQASSYYQSTLLELEPKRLEEMYHEYPKLEEYRVYFQRAFRYQKYMLSYEKEKFLVDLTKAFSDNENIFNSLTDSDMDFGTILDEHGKEAVLTNTNYKIFIESKDRRVRKDAFTKLYQVFKRYRTTLASCLENHVKQTATFNKVRGYQSSLYAAMYADELDENVFSSLVESVSQGLEPLFKYYRLKKEILGVEELHLYDIYTSAITDYHKKYTYEEAKELIKKTLSVFGEDYVANIEKAFQEKWIDLLPNTGKTGGAFSGGCYDTYPYILTNFQETFGDVSTLIHELGHSMHSYYSRNHNSYVYGNYSIVVAEVASTVNELLLAYYVIEHSKDPKEKLYILDLLMNLFKGTIYRQTMYEEFEKFLYDKVEKEEALTSEVLCEEFYALNKKYFGKDVVVDDEIRYEWERMPHLYYNFYMYKYATGLSAACYIVHSIRSGEKDAVKNYLEFLKQGSRMAPNEELKITGVDLTKKEVCDNAIAMFSEIVNEFEKTYNEYKRSGEVNE